MRNVIPTATWLMPVLAGLLALASGGGCAHHATVRADVLEDWRAWQLRRHESLAGTNGWLSIVARHWLAEGRTEAGADPSSPLRLPAGRSPDRLGTFVRQGMKVRFEPAPGVKTFVDGQPVDPSGVALRTDVSPPGSRLQAGPLAMVVIERGTRQAVRVRDPESPRRTGFEGLRWFAYDPGWRVEARFEPWTAPRTLRVADVSGGTQELASPGELVFSHRGRDWRLAVVDEPGEPEFFLMFRDATAGRSTYGNGRFLSVPRPDARGRVVMDFNRAYTPPCGFTPFATCPIPPRGNLLPFAIEAGEKAPRPLPGH